MDRALQEENLICDDFDDVISHFLSLCAAPGCSTSLLSNRKDLMLFVNASVQKTERLVAAVELLKPKQRQIVSVSVCLKEPSPGQLTM